MYGKKSNLIFIEEPESKIFRFIGNDFEGILIRETKLVSSLVLLEIVDSRK